MSLISGSWKNTHLVCGNHPDSEVAPKMELAVSGATMTPIYACVERNGATKCPNCISLREYEKMLDHIAKEIISAEENDESVNLTNFCWRKKSLYFDIKKHSNDEVVVSVRDRLLCP
jgi:hypothetical protein